MWLHDLIGIESETRAAIHDALTFRDGVLTSRLNGRVMQAGTLSTPSLAELRLATAGLMNGPAPLSFREVIGDAAALHADPANAGACFQVASQFNLLEMVSPGVTPDDGIAGYEHDHTQGPACAMACGAGTLVRNYFVPIGGQTGQSALNQIDCAADLGAALRNAGDLWEMRNGYLLPGPDGLSLTNARIAAGRRDDLMGRLRIGVHSETEVTIASTAHRVTQLYCSAVPVAYSGLPAAGWEPLARLVLDAAYEASFHAALLNRSRTGDHRLFLTLLGGGAFGNPPGWIIGALTRALDLFADSGLDVAVVSYGRASAEIAAVMRARS